MPIEFKKVVENDFVAAFLFGVSTTNCVSGGLLHSAFQLVANTTEARENLKARITDNFARATGGLKDMLRPLMPPQASSAAMPENN